MEKQQIPPGWEYNPSAWSERWPIIVLAGVGFAIAMYLALYQWGVFATVWEPFFGDGSERILHSSVSRLLPVPDAFLGALGYLLDIVTGAIGGPGRWRRKMYLSPPTEARAKAMDSHSRTASSRRCRLCSWQPTKYLMVEVVRAAPTSRFEV